MAGWADAVRKAASTLAKGTPAPQAAPAGSWYNPFGGGSASTWADVVNSAPVNRTVYIDPATGYVYVTTDPRKQVEYAVAGYERRQVTAADWPAFYEAFGPSIVNDDMGQTAMPSTIPAPTQRQQDYTEGYGNINAAAGATQENLSKAFDIAQPGRDRAALQTKENYGSVILPTLTSAAFSGAGYHQALNDIFGKAVDRDRTLAGLADAQTSAGFQLGLQQQSAEEQRRAQLAELYSSYLGQNQQRYDNSAETFTQWAKP